MRRRGRLAIACYALLLVAAGCQAPEGTGPGQVAPPFSALDRRGGEVSLSELRGEVVLLNLWATWCLPCRAEMPALETLHREQEKDGLRVVGVSIDGAGSGEEIAAYLARHGLTFQILHDPEMRALAAFETDGVPATFLIGRNGRILRRWVGRIDPLSPGVRSQVDEALGSRR